MFTERGDTVHIISLRKATRDEEKNYAKEKNSRTPEPPELTAEDFARMRPAEDVVPRIVQKYRRTRGPQKAPKKEPTTIRLDADVSAYFKAQGRGWQTRINAVLRQAMIQSRRTKRAKKTA